MGAISLAMMKRDMDRFTEKHAGQPEPKFQSPLLAPVGDLPQGPLAAVEYVEDNLADVVNNMWRVLTHELDYVLRQVCDHVLREEGASDDVRKHRAEALLMIGDIFQVRGLHRAVLLLADSYQRGEEFVVWHNACSYAKCADGSNACRSLDVLPYCPVPLPFWSGATSFLVLQIIIPQTQALLQLVLYVLCCLAVQ